MPIHTYTNWNVRPNDETEQIEPYRKYCIICEGANTETFYFKHLIDIRKDLGIHPLIDVCLWEKTEQDRDISYAKKLVEFATQQKLLPENNFDQAIDKMIVVFDGDIFESKVVGYEQIINTLEKNNDIPAISNPAFELFLLLHIDNAYTNYIQGHEEEFLRLDENNKYSYAYNILKKVTGMNAKKNKNIGKLADNVQIAIEQERNINQDIHNIKGKVSSNVGLVIERIINEKPL